MACSSLSGSNLAGGATVTLCGGHCVDDRQFLEEELSRRRREEPIAGLFKSEQAFGRAGELGRLRRRTRIRRHSVKRKLRNAKAKFATDARLSLSFEDEFICRRGRVALG
ncbi:hypothetical protein METY_2781 [Methylopila sp. Yamaguchi]|nr:hypothetical protein METY_2781 [Methylopila sp. Yamaguchi]